MQAYFISSIKFLYILTQDETKPQNFESWQIKFNVPTKLHFHNEEATFGSASLGACALTCCSLTTSNRFSSNI